MVYFSTLFVAAVAVGSVAAAPTRHMKRINQITIDATVPWKEACIAAGAQGCADIASKAAGTLLGGGSDCGQQDSADEMVTLAKATGNNPEMIRLAQIFVQQPRNSIDKLSIAYCTVAPKNAELNGLFHCQFEGTDPNKFAKLGALGAPGTVPLGVAAVNPPGSCPALATPVPVDDQAGRQLHTLVNDPRGASGGGNAAAPPAAAPPAAAPPAAGVIAAPAAGGNTVTVKAGDTCGAVASSAGTTVAALLAANPSVNAGCTNLAVGQVLNVAGGAAAPVAAAPAPPAAAPAPAAPAPAAGGFQLSNGQEAQKLNAKFAGLNAASTCTDGEQACVAGGFAQCVGGKFLASGCAGGTQCFALPLVNKAGTSITCSTEADAIARIANTGATGGLRG